MNNNERKISAQEYLNSESDRIESLYNAGELNDTEYAQELGNVYTKADEMRREEERTTSAQEYLNSESDRIENLYNAGELNDTEYAQELGDVYTKADEMKADSENEPIQETMAINLVEKLEEEKKLLAQAENDYQKSLTEMKRIFAEEQELLEKNGPFKTVEELEFFTQDYMNQKLVENDRLIEAKNRLDRTQKRLSNLEKQTKVKNEISLIYDSPSSLKEKSNPRKKSITLEDKENIKQNISNVPKQLSNHNKKKTTTPGKAPYGVPAIEDKKSSTNPLLTGPTLQNRPLGITGPTLDNNSREEPVSQTPTTPLTKDRPKKEPAKESNIPQPEKAKEVPNKKEDKGPKKGLMSILEEVTKNLELTRKDGKRYRASNIQVKENFKRELSSGNYLYNIVHFVPTLTKVPFQLITKLSGKIMYRQENKQRIETLKRRLDNLSEEDLMTIYTEYRSGKVNQERFPTALNTLLDERIQKFAMDKVTAINTKLEAQYKDIFGTIKQLEAIDRSLADKKTSVEDKKSLKEYRANILAGKATEVQSIRDNYIEANNWLSGGLHGFSEDMKAASTKLSCVGKRFAKDHDLDLDLLKKEAALERAELKAIATNDDEMALRVFVQAESLLSANTEVKNSIFGKRSTGKKYYSPLAEQLDYKDDPFIRDLFTTVAVTSAALSAANALRVHGKEGHEFLDKQREEAEHVNSLNNRKMTHVNKAGRDIVSRRDDMMEGMKAQTQSDILNSGNEIERAALDKSAETYGGWALRSNEYHNYDAAGHEFYNDFYNQTQASIQEVATKYGAGQLTEQQAMEMLSNISDATNHTFRNVTNECLEILKPYATAHPQFDLSGVQDAMDYLVQHPTAISRMNEAMVDTTNIGESLIGLSAAQVTALTSLPSDLQTTLLSAASAGALAYRVSSTMQENENRGKYGNDVTKMVDEYIERTTPPVQNEQQNNR